MLGRTTFGLVRHRTSRRTVSWTVAAVVCVAMLSACAVGTGTLRIADAEAEIVAVAEEVMAEAGLEPANPVRAAPLEQCELRSGGSGLRTRVEVRAPLPGGAAVSALAFDAAAAVLVARGLVLVESGVPGTLLGQRDGITVTIGSDGRDLEIDAITGCRPR
jgi:hypothetical protein